MQPYAKPQDDRECIGHQFSPIPLENKVKDLNYLSSLKNQSSTLNNAKYKKKSKNFFLVSDFIHITIFWICREK